MVVPLLEKVFCSTAKGLRHSRETSPYKPLLIIKLRGIIMHLQSKWLVFDIELIGLWKTLDAPAERWESFKAYILSME